MYDDTCLKVMGLHERCSLSPEDVSAIASLDSAHTAGRGREAHEAAAVWVQAVDFDWGMPCRTEYGVPCRTVGLGCACRTQHGRPCRLAVELDDVDAMQ